jgi:hypothetical protein
MRQLTKVEQAALVQRISNCKSGHYWNKDGCVNCQIELLNREVRLEKIASKTRMTTIRVDGE